MERKRRRRRADNGPLPRRKHQRLLSVCIEAVLFLTTDPKGGVSFFFGFDSGEETTHDESPPFSPTGGTDKGALGTYFYLLL